MTPETKMPPVREASSDPDVLTGNRFESTVGTAKTRWGEKNLHDSLLPCQVIACYGQSYAVAKGCRPVGKRLRSAGDRNPTRTATPDESRIYHKKPGRAWVGDDWPPLSKKQGSVGIGGGLTSQRRIRRNWNPEPLGGYGYPAG